MTLKTTVEALGDHGIYWASGPRGLGELIHDARLAHELQRQRDKLEGFVRYMAFDAMKGSDEQYKKEFYLDVMKRGSLPFWEEIEREAKALEEAT
jgi:hypothetical protein